MLTVKVHPFFSSIVTLFLWFFCEDQTQISPVIGSSRCTLLRNDAFVLRQVFDLQLNGNIAWKSNRAHTLRAKVRLVLCKIAVKPLKYFSYCLCVQDFFCTLSLFSTLQFSYSNLFFTDLQTLTDGSIIAIRVQQTDTRTDVRLCDWFVSARSAQRRTSDRPLHTSANKLWSKGKTGCWV